MENILLVSKEVLRKDYLGCYTSKLYNTPNIDELARNGTVFNNYYTAAPSTAMAITCMFSGLNAYELRRKDYSEVEPFTQAETLFNVLENRGYETHVIWDKVFMKMAWPYSKVFDRNTKIHNLDIARHVRESNFADKEYTKVKPEIDSIKVIWREIEKIIKNNKKPIFIWLHCPHVLQPRRSYGGDIDLFDKLIGKIIKNNFGKIYLTADHGHLRGEKNIFNYGFHLFEGVVNIPLITYPKIEKKTVERLIGANQLNNIILENKIKSQEYIYSDTQYYLQHDRKLMIRKNDYKYIYYKKWDAELFFDLSYDEEENINLLIYEWGDPDRKVKYLLDDFYNYNRWKEAKKIYEELQKERKRIWKKGKAAEEFYYWTKNIYKRGILKSLFNRRKIKVINGRWDSRTFNSLW